MVPAVGSRVGRLTVTRVYRTERGRKGRTLIEAVCDCGTAKTVAANNIGRGSLSCGCLMRERASEANRTHGLSKTREYIAWLGAKARCSNPRCAAFPDYGGRGITMSPEWLANFETFLRDMGSSPLGMSLDRIDNDGPYAPENCRWATTKQQANNRRGNRTVAMGGIVKTIAEWAVETGIPYDAIKQRLGKLGWSAERALTTPAGRAAA